MFSNSYGCGAVLPSKTDSFFPLYPAISSPWPQYRSNPLTKISFTIPPPDFQALRIRVGSRVGSGYAAASTRATLNLYPPISFPWPQSRSNPLSEISFPIHPSDFQALRIRVGSRYAAASTRATLQDAVSVEEPCSFYDLLGIPETGSLLEIKQAYKQLARKYHPDVSPPGLVQEYTQRFIRVQEAYETLSDPNRRALYDRDMAKGLHLAFSSRRRYQNYDDQMEEKGEWKSRWQDQVSELKRRSMYKDAGSMSWGARMRRQKK
ncbi:chaperone protein dnaJ 20, chloroplastic-like [Coffea arabica]